MGKRIDINENNLYLVFEINDENRVKFLHFSSIPFEESTVEENEKAGFKLVEVSMTGIDRPEERHGTKYIVTAPGYRLQYKKHEDYRNDNGRKLEIVTFDEETGIEVVSHFQFYDGISIVRSWTVVKNCGKETQGIDYVSSFALTGIAKEGIEQWDKKMRLYIPHNSWARELQWKDYSLPDLGLSHGMKWERSSKSIAVTNKGAWSSKEYIPMGYIENRETGTNLFWQIENNGSWHWEISDQTNHIYLQLSGPTENEAHWWKNLAPGEEFVSIPAAVGAVAGDFNDAMGQLTHYR